ncbi:MAG: putative metallo-hydrolase YycJ [Tenericutes bacterium ADurb.Bin087]|nr:MAG: putative metallo-hydrolase YycJ [Tenericutes bacterium ADurb.Bin087]
MKYFILASGSKGNATIIKGPVTKLLIDLGISLKEYTERLNIFNLQKERVFAVLFTHKHSDHITTQFNKVANGNVYAPLNTLPFDAPYKIVTPYTPFTINEFTITPLPTSHDVSDSVGYIIETKDHKLVYMTDTGYISTRNLELMKNADAYILEANHSPGLLLKTNRPFDLIQRILSDTGHLSNEAAAHYLAELIGPRTRHIVLAHLSEEANTPEVALETLDKVLRKYGIDQSKLTIVTANQYVPITGDLNEN